MVLSMNLIFSPQPMFVLSSALLLATAGCTRLQPPDVAPQLAVAEQLRDAFGGEQAAAKVVVAVALCVRDSLR